MRVSFPIPDPFPGETLTLEEAERRLLTRLEDPEGDPRPTFWYLGILYRRMGRPKEAIPYLKRLSEMLDDPEAKAEMLANLGGLAELANDFSTAAEFYQTAYSLEPRDPDTSYSARNNLGYCLNRLGRFEEAKLYLAAALALDSHRHNAYKNMGVAMEGCGDHGQAAEHYIKAVLLQPCDARALGHLEKLVDRMPGLLEEVPHLVRKIEFCRQAVKQAQAEFEKAQGGKPCWPMP